MNKLIKDIVIRYVILLVLGIFFSYIFYTIFTPLTIYPVFFILKQFYSVELVENVLKFNGLSIELTEACIAGAAYYLLLILNLTTPLTIKTRIKSIIFLIFTFLILNIIRIIIFTFLAIKGYQYFDLAHLLIWYIGSTLLILLIWFSNVRIFKIKSVPVYIDLINLKKLIKYK